MAQRILDVGCGESKIPGAIGVDVRQAPGVDVIAHLERYPWPFQSSVFDEVLFNDTLEHLDNVIRAMQEVHRVTRAGGHVKILTPHFSHPDAFRDPTHKHYFTYQTIDYFTGAMPHLQYGGGGLFRLIQRRFVFTKGQNLSKWVATHVHHKKYERYLSRLFPAEKLYFELEVVKEGSTVGGP